MNARAGRAAKRVGLEVLGWTLVVVGIAAIPLPGPGLFGIVAGLAVLSQQYEWAERRLEPVKQRAMLEAAKGVQSPTRITISLLGVVTLCAVGALWIASPPAPGWWPVRESWWLFGGLWTGITQIGSGLFALGLVVYSYRRFHADPDAVSRMTDEVAAADRANPASDTA